MRDAFNGKKVSTSVIKCTNAFNQYGVRDEIINKQTVGSECLRCSEPEIWDYVIKCRKTIEFRRKFIEDLLADLMKSKPKNIQYEELFDIVEDILMYMEVGDEEEYTTNQHIIGMRSLFRDYIVKI